jgi:hypothetical protein
MSALPYDDWIVSSPESPRLPESDHSDFEDPLAITPREREYGFNWRARTWRALPIDARVALNPRLATEPPPRFYLGDLFERKSDKTVFMIFYGLLTRGQIEYAFISQSGEKMNVFDSDIDTIFNGRMSRDSGPANYPIKSFNLPQTSKIEIEVSREMARNIAKWHTVRV